MAIVEAHGYPIALHIDSASPGEATLVENTVEAKIIDDLPPRLIGDKAYDSDGLDKKLAEKYQVEMILCFVNEYTHNHGTSLRYLMV